MLKNRRIRIVQFGLGPIGRELLRHMARQRRFHLVGAVDSDPEMSGRLLREVLNDPKAPRLRVSADGSSCLHACKPDIVFHTTGSSLQKVAPQIEQIVRCGAHCISSTEELAYPWLKHRPLARRLDRLAKSHRVCILGTGVNPGFVMDLLPVVLSGVCQTVKSIRVDRVVDASRRRLPLQRKIGTGLVPRDFRSLARRGRIGHVGLLESAALIAAGLGMRPTRWSQTIRPKVAGRRIVTRHFIVPRGRVIGLRQTVTGYHGRTPRIILDLTMTLAGGKSRDRIRIDGTPPLEATISPGIHGDLATVAALTNSAVQVLDFPRHGLVTVLDLPAPRSRV